MSVTRSRYLFNTLLYFGVVITFIRVLYSLRQFAWATPYVPVAVAVVLIYMPVFFARWRKEPIDYIDRTRQQWMRSFVLFGLVTVIILPPFLLMNHYWQDIVFDLHFRAMALPQLLWVMIDQLFLVSVPEEIFFRGWLQGRLNRVFNASWNIFGVRIGWSWLFTAFLFALAHSLVTFQWWHFSIFFPGLLFGWLKEKTGTITAASLFHCVSNLVAYWIGYNYM